MEEQDIIETREGPAALGVAAPLFSAASAAVILALAAWMVIAALGPAPPAPTAADYDRPPGRHLQTTFVYVVWSAEEALKLRHDFEEWDQALKDGGFPMYDVKRLVVTQSIEDVRRGRYFDFSVISPDDGPGSEFRFIDLRR